MTADNARVWRAVEAVERVLNGHLSTRALKVETKIRLAAECATAALDAYAEPAGKDGESDG